MLTLEKAYQILNVSPNASDEEIRKAYRKMAKDLHPDTHPDDPYAEAKFKLLQEAKEIIEKERSMASGNSSSGSSSNSSSGKSSNSSSGKSSNSSSGKSSNSSSGERSSRSNFASEHSSMMKKLSDIYSCLKKGKYREIEKNSEYREIAYKCAYGVLLRHALECIVHDKSKEIHVIAEGRSSDELLFFLLENYPFDYDTKKALFDAKFFTNKLTHIEHFSFSGITFESCKDFYNKVFKKIIENHISSNKRRTQKYLRKIYDHLESFDIKNNITSTLLLGNLMRQILECIVDLWIYNVGYVVGNESTIHDKIYFLHERLNDQNYYSYATIAHLHEIRMAVNQAMHVSHDNKMNISKIRSGLLEQTRTLDFEITMPTVSQKRKLKKPFSFKKALLWIFFFPIMLCITIAKSRMGILGKIFLICFTIHLSFTGIMFVLQKLTMDSPSLIQPQKATVITIDVEKMSNGLISGYNNYGYFSDEEFSETKVIEDEEYFITIKKDFSDEKGTHFKLKVNKNNMNVGVASIKATCPQYLSNLDEIAFSIDEQKSDGLKIELINTTVVVKNLENIEIVRNDPREYFKIICNREASDGWLRHKWNKFEVTESEYTVEDKTIRLSVIEDKRPGVKEVNPGLKFEVFGKDDELLATGSYIFTGLQYDANNDDYGNMEGYFFDFKANFEQAEMLGKTGILFIDTTENYTFYH